MKNPLVILQTDTIARISREQLTADELERLQGTEELELSANSRAAASMSGSDTDERGKIYSVGNLRGTLLDEEDDTNETVRNGLEELVRQLGGYDYLWLV